ncbi:MAG TPA: hypothetical protein VFD64_09080 [Gemmatimonadaceae bacterium]|nr:hypothetical protein [Gemmatimonadaceae bacterium]
MSDMIRAYVNGRGVDVPAGARALDAVRAFDADIAAQVVAGDRALTDSRGLPLEASAEVSTGSIIRIVSGRRRGAATE